MIYYGELVMKSLSKKITAAAVAAVLLVLSALPAGALEIKRYYGDIDDDGVVSTSDAREILLIALEISDKELGDTDMLCADVDKNGRVTVNDARLALLAAIEIASPELMPPIPFDPCTEEFLSEINGLRSRYANKALEPLVLSDELSNVAYEAAKEFADVTGTAYYTADGSHYYKLLDDNNISYSVADKFVVAASTNYKKAYRELVDNEQCKKAMLSSNFSKIGIAAYSNDGRTFYWCMFFTGD